MALRQPVLDPGEWLPIGEAALLTGQPVRTLRYRCKQWADAGLARLGPPVEGKGKPVWYVSRNADKRLARYVTRQTRDQLTRDALIQRYPNHLVERALRRNFWLQRWRKAIAENRGTDVTDRDLAARIAAEATRTEAEGFQISARSLYRWWHQYTRLGADGRVGVKGLVDRYGDGQPDRPTRSPEAVAFFYDLYHTLNKLAVVTCHEVTLREARRRGWTWPAGYSATWLWLKDHDDRSLTCLMRYGPDVWARKYLPHLRMDYTTLEPGEMYVCDHTQCDFWVRYKNRQIRPWLTAIQDLRTRCIAGWHLGPAPHQDAILCAMRMAFRDWAIPSVMRIDNGRDFCSKPITGFTKRERDRLRQVYGAQWHQVVKRSENLIECSDPRWLGITGELGIELIYAIPYSPWSKGTLERWFGTFEGQLAKTLPSYTGNEPKNRPACLDQIRLHDPEAVPTLEDARGLVSEYLDVYHRRKHSGLAGCTPSSVSRSAATRLRKAVGDELAFLMDVRGLYKVTANGVSLRVGAGTFHYGSKSQVLKQHVGRKVLIALDPADVSHCFAFTPDRDKRRMIARLDSDEGVPPYSTADDAREAVAEIKREQSVMHKAGRAYAKRTKRMADRMREHRAAVRAELLATGTDDAKAQPRIVPVRTGFEGVSKPDRQAVEKDAFRPLGPEDLDDLYGPEDLSVPVDAFDDEGVEDLFIDDERDEESDGGLGELWEANTETSLTS